MNRETETIVARLTSQIKELEEERDAVILTYNQADAECALSRTLLTRAADALECHNLDHLQDDLIAELRKAAE